MLNKKLLNEIVDDLRSVTSSCNLDVTNDTLFVQACTYHRQLLIEKKPTNLSTTPTKAMKWYLGEKMKLSESDINKLSFDEASKKIKEHKEKNDKKTN